VTTGTYIRHREDARLSAVISLLVEAGRRRCGHVGVAVIILHLLITLISVFISSFVHGDTLNILMVSTPHVPPGVDHLLVTSTVGNISVDCVTTLDLGASATDGEPLRIISLLADDLWQDPPPGVDEPVAHLEDGETSLLSQEGLLLVTGVGVVSVLVQPASQDVDGILAQVSSPLPPSHGHGSGVLTATVVISTGG